MTIAGIIAEYNPFHNGHAYQIEKVRELGVTHVAVVMDGAFTQRGECAVLEKHSRARAALTGGADLVIELPLPYAVASAERFAYGGVAALDALGCVELLVFGSECGELAPLLTAARALESPALHDALGALLAQGLVFPKARQLALAEVMGKECAQVLTEPNNILGVEYLKWLSRLHSPMLPVTIQRTGAMHGSRTASGIIASASLIRARMLSGKPWQDYVPKDAAAIYRAQLAEDKAPCSLLPLERAILGRLRGLSREELLRYPDVTEGLESRILKAVRTAESLDLLYQLIKTKRYTLSRIRRMVLCSYLGITAELQAEDIPYLRVLGFNARGAEILAKAKRTARLPLGSSLAKLAKTGGSSSRFAAAEAAATDIFCLCSPKILPCGLDFTSEAVIIK